MFRLPPNLVVAQNYGIITPEAVVPLEVSLPPRSRVLIGLVFERRYEGFERDCQKAEEELRKLPGLLPWPELSNFVTPDEDGQPVVWIHYLSSPVWWAILLVILAPIFLLPILGAFGMWVVEKMFPGITEAITMIVMLMVVGGIMVFMPKMLAPAKEEK
jgi:hypothetical protein